MAALIMVKPGLDWQSSGGLFDWTLEFIISKLSDTKTAKWLQTIIDNNLGSLWVPDLPIEAQEEILRVLRSGVVEAAQRDLPEGPGKAATIKHLQELVALTDSDPRLKP